MKVVKASELGVYLYCKRAWLYQQKGLESQNMPELARGAAFHQRHGLRVLLAIALKAFAVICFLAAGIAALVLVFG